MNLRELESLIVERLRGVLPAGLAVETFPDNPAVYDVKAAKGAVLVRYNGSRFGRTDAAMQRRDIEFVAAIGARSLRGTDAHFGCYDLLDIVRGAVTSWEVQTDDVPEITFYPGSESFVLEKSGIWWFQITFTGFTLYTGEYIAVEYGGR